jgi:AcrR family transcriptional regulator
VTPAGGNGNGTGTATGRRPLRRDAEVNLARILDAARLVFAEQGYDASMETIAERADVGVGTLYRRFPNKSELFEAVVDEAKRRNREIAEAVLDEVPDGESVFEFVRRCVAAPSCWRATTEAPPWRSTGTGLDLLAPLLDEILARSQRAGTVRTDLVGTDIVVALLSVRAIADVCDTTGSAPSLRFLELVLDGFRPGAPAGPGRPALSVAQLDRLLRQR